MPTLPTSPLCHVFLSSRVHPSPPLPLPRCKRSSPLPLFLTRHGLASFPLTACRAPGGHHAHAGTASERASRQETKQPALLLHASTSNAVLPLPRGALGHFVNIPPSSARADPSACPCPSRTDGMTVPPPHCMAGLATQPRMHSTIYLLAIKLSLIRPITNNQTFFDKAYLTSKNAMTNQQTKPEP